MTVYMFVGKGGVGKTTTAAAFAWWLSSQPEHPRHVAVIDYDGGHSIPLTFGLGHVTPNTQRRVNDRLSVVVVEPPSFRSIEEVKDDGGTVHDYLGQFPGDTGLVAWADLPHEFFGVPTDVPMVQRFVVLVEQLLALKKARFDAVIIDVEPTAGLVRLLTAARRMSDSLRNLGAQSFVIRSALGLTWPDIRAFLDSAYIDRTNDYADRLEEACTMLVRSWYALVCTPQVSPVQQMFALQKLIDGVRFEGAHGRIAGYIVNSLHGRPGEEAAIAPVLRRNLPVVRIPWVDALQEDDDARQAALLEIGGVLATELRLATEITGAISQ